MSERQRKIIQITALTIGITSLFLYFQGELLGAGIGIMTMGIICTCIKKAGGELNVLVGLMPILIYFEQRMLLVFLSLILLVAALYDLVVISETKNNLTGEDKKQRGQEFLEKFREKELVHALCVKLVRLLGIKR